MLSMSKPKRFPVRTGCILLLGLYTTTILVSTAFAQTVDENVVIVANGNLLTMNPNQPTASAMALKDGKIIEVGDLAAVKKAAGKSYEYVDLEGKTVVPGFIESHEHMMQYGATLSFLDITPFVCPSVQDALQKLKQQGKPDGDGWIYAWAADPTLYTDKRAPTRRELDELFPDTPVFIFHMSGHGAYVNSKALELAGVTKDTPNPKGGEFEKDEHGELTGYLKGMPAWLMVGKLPPFNQATITNSANLHARHGFTTTTELAIVNSNMLILLE